MFMHIKKPLKCLQNPRDAFIIIIIYKTDIVHTQGSKVLHISCIHLLEWVHINKIKVIATYKVELKWT